MRLCKTAAFCSTDVVCKLFNGEINVDDYLQVVGLEMMSHFNCQQSYCISEAFRLQISSGELSEQACSTAV